MLSITYKISFLKFFFVHNRTIPNIIQNRTYFEDTGSDYFFLLPESKLDSMADLESYSYGGPSYFVNANFVNFYKDDEKVNNDSMAIFPVFNIPWYHRSWDHPGWQGNDSMTDLESYFHGPSDPRYYVPSYFHGGPSYYYGPICFHGPVQTICANLVDSYEDAEKIIPLTYSEICNFSNLEKGLARTKSGKSAGLDDDVKATWTQSKLEKLASELKSHKFKASPIKKVWIPKSDGGKRRLGISSQKDKIVQATILERLEKETEKVFLDCSYGFRPKRGCHDVLHSIKRKWQNVTWLISIDISNYFDSTHHQVLIDLLKPYGDQAFIELVGKLLKAGYMDISNLSNSWERTSKGVPRCSLISPVLANIYLHELDVFVTNELIPMYSPIGGLYYVRYADDLIFGYTGSKKNAFEIRNKVIEFIVDKLKFKVKTWNSEINHSSDKNILFLGYFIRYFSPKEIISILKAGNQSEIVERNRAQLRIPVERILSRLKDKGYAVTRKEGTYRATSNRKLTRFDDKLIVNHFSSFIKALLNYYRPANQYTDLWSVVDLLRKSCALSLADKHKLKTAAKAYKRYGPKLKIKDPIRPDSSVELFYPESLKTTNNFHLSKRWMNLSVTENDGIQDSYKSNVKIAKKCQYPGCGATDSLERHHINELRNLKKKGLHPYLKSLIAKKRKTVTLCSEHHKQLHAVKRSGKTKNPEKGLEQARAK